MNNIPFFSIITVSFNSSKTIERTINSILQQKFTDYEYIIVDGGSNDGTIEIIKRYESAFEGRMRWISEPDKGIYDAFNKGIKRSTGAYVWIVNSDDYIEPDALEYLTNVIKSEIKDSDTVISAKSNYIDEKSMRVLYTFYKDAKEAMRCYKLDKMGVVHPATIVPKSVYDKYGLYDDRYKLSGDQEWFHRIYKSKVLILFKDRVITNMSNAGVSGTFNWKRFCVSWADKRIFFQENYHNFIIREFRKIFWVIDFVRVAFK